MSAKKPNKRKPMVAYSDAAQHEELRQLLKNHEPVTYGQLRREHALSPVFLETQIAKFPEIFQGSTELSSGKPTIRLQDGQLESREDILMRRVLIRAVRQAGANGVRLIKLYNSTRIPSLDVQRLLAGVAEIAITERKARGGSSDILYRWTGGEKSRIQESEQAAAPLLEPVGEPNAELETTRQKLVVLLEKTHRHLSWLSEFLDPVLIRRVLDRWPDQFTVETVNLGNPDLIIRNKRCPDAASPPAVADGLASSAPQAANGPSEPLQTIFAAGTLQELKWKPGCVEMGRRRNGRAAIRGDRVVR